MCFLLRPHHHPVHTPHGRGGHLGGSHRHHLQREDALLRLLALPEEVLRQRLLPDAGARGERQDDGTEKRDHSESGQGFTDSKKTTFSTQKRPNIGNLQSGNIIMICFCLSLVLSKSTSTITNKCGT